MRRLHTVTCAEKMFSAHALLQHLHVSHQQGHLSHFSVSLVQHEAEAVQPGLWGRRCFFFFLWNSRSRVIRVQIISHFLFFTLRSTLFTTLFWENYSEVLQKKWETQHGRTKKSNLLFCVGGLSFIQTSAACNFSTEGRLCKTDPPTQNVPKAPNAHWELLQRSLNLTNLSKATPNNSNKPSCSCFTVKCTIYSLL